MSESPLWSPSPETIVQSSMKEFQSHIEIMTTLKFDNYNEFHQWSVDNPGEFWTSLIDYYNVAYEGNPTPAVKNLNFSDYSWFPNLKMNFAKNLLKEGKDKSIAFNFVHESGLKREVSYKQLREEVGSFQQSLSSIIQTGDVLACYMPNIPETAVSMLATTGLGGVFTSTSSDFGVNGVLDRFSQSKPKVLVAAAGYDYNGKYFDLTDKLLQIEKELPSLEKLVIVDFLNKGVDLSKFKKAALYSDMIKAKGECRFIDVPFDSPLYIMYSSGTTGKPKCIVHSVGGTLLQHVKELGLHTNLTSEKNIFYFTTCGWMMWNWLVSSLFFGSKITLYEGSPGFPSLKDFFKIVETEKINIFGTSPKFLRALEDNGYDKEFKLESLQTILSTGAPLLPEQYDFVYNKIKQDVCLSSICGGTDIIGCFFLGNPAEPVYRGEIQSLGLGMDISCFNDKGKEVLDSEGELVCRKSFPSRPICFLNDENNEKINNAYFNRFKDVWHHGDFITLTSRKTVKVFGRSDATLNPGGVRIGTAEIYRQTESLPYLADSLCVGRPADGDVEVVLFVKLNEGEDLSEDRVKEIKTQIRKNTTPRHVPSHVWTVTDIPYTRSGKKMELAISRILQGKELSNKEAVANPECLSQYNQFASS
ncbi:MAG: acetoacetate--CoA ligase [Bacteriovoracaceae bacterium]|nr:acetoacetate--CoA ligase [Bacteriovoracaceae bacterium]